MKRLNWTNIYIENEDKRIYKIEGLTEHSSPDGEIGFTVECELICGWDYINPDCSNVQGYVSPDRFVDDIQSESFTFYPLKETLIETIEIHDFEIVPSGHMNAIKECYNIEY